MIVESFLDSRAFLVRGAPGESLPGLDRAQVIGLFKERGLLLFKGFETDPQRFCDATQLYGKSFGKIGGTLRTNANEDGSLFQVTDGHSDLEFHTELGHSPCRPDIIWFWCLEPAESGGETRLFDGSEFPAELTAEEADCFRGRRLKYSHRMPEVMWKGFFSVETAAECEAYLGRSEGVLFAAFDSRDTLTFQYVVPAIRRTKFGARDAFVNSISILCQKYESSEGERPVVFSPDPDADGTAFSMSVTFEDGSEIPAPLLTRIRQVSEKLSFSYKLGPGEILMIDNTRFQHARSAFRGRRVLLTRFAQAAFD